MVITQELFEQILVLAYKYYTSDVCRYASEEHKFKRAMRKAFIEFITKE